MSQAPANHASNTPVHADAANASGDASVDSPAKTSAPIRMSKVLQIEIKGSLSSLQAQGGTAGMWQPLEGKHTSMFGTESSIGMSAENDAGSMMLNAEMSSAINSLRNVTMRKATILQSHNTFPVPLGVNISCLPRNEVCETGNAYTFTTIPKTTVNTPFVVYESSDKQDSAAEWRQNYSNFNASNLETQDVLTVEKSPYVFVNECHPVINLLRMNKTLLGVDVDKIPKMDNQWYKITHELMRSSCDTLRNRVLSQIKTANLMQMNAQIHRVGGMEWDTADHVDTLASFSPDPTWNQETVRTSLQQHETDFVEKPCVFMCRLHLEYEIQK